MSRVDVVREVVKMDERVEKLSRAVYLMAQYVALHTSEKENTDSERHALFEQIMQDGECQEQISRALTYQRSDERREYVERVEGALVRISEVAKNPKGPRCDTSADWAMAEMLRLRDVPPNTIIPGPAPTAPSPLRITEPPTTNPPF